jgi:hypothetical protein
MTVEVGNLRETCGWRKKKNRLSHCGSMGISQWEERKKGVRSVVSGC